MLEFVNGEDLSVLYDVYNQEAEKTAHCLSHCRSKFNLD